MTKPSRDLFFLFIIFIKWTARLSLYISFRHPQVRIIENPSRASMFGTLCHTLCVYNFQNQCHRTVHWVIVICAIPHIDLKLTLVDAEYTLLQILLRILYIYSYILCIFLIFFVFFCYSLLLGFGSVVSNSIK